MYRKSVDNHFLFVLSYGRTQGQPNQKNRPGRNRAESRWKACDRMVNVILIIWLALRLRLGKIKKA